ncbi:ABC transporter substrate-binding protein [Thalassolituus sp.]|uniref:ABC transporter substrate-binding protein n=1 Tax=Thalassolituus sp. TaxID=2030822 RepID=UPI002A82BB9D|nr:ABC transporter substrate-binding protein [Thalassolituus sp.]
MMKSTLKSTIFRPLLILLTAASIAACSKESTPEPEAKAENVKKEMVKVSLFSWPGYGFWYIAKEKNLVPELELDIQIIEDPYESFGLMTAGQLDITSSTVEYGPIAVDQGVPVKLVTYTNPSYGTDKILMRSDIATPQDLIGKKVAVLEGGLTQIFMGIWLEENGVAIDQVEFVNVIMDEAVGAMLGGDVAAAEFWEPFGSQAIAGMPEAKIMATSAEDKWISTALLGDGMYMTSKLLEERPEAAKLAMKAYFAAVDWWKANPIEGNKIIADAIKFSEDDVAMVIGNDGEILKGGIFVFDKEEAGRFMGLIPGELPLGMKNGQIVEHWNTTNTWWNKFGQTKASHDWTTGVVTAPLASVLTDAGLKTE